CGDVAMWRFFHFFSHTFNSSFRKSFFKTLMVVIPQQPLSPLFYSPSPIPLNLSIMVSSL
ncbi:MAG: hypothetical protein EBZ49_14495, partial [Proteobacteria bacterium]|nr:hypothetical protein [Pseudomonadota bacterium]